MRRALWLAAILVATQILVSTPGRCEDEIYYTRCNLKVLANNEITWINWQMAPSMLPLGTKVRVSKDGKSATLVAVGTNTTYKLDVGAEGKQFLEKFVTKKAADLGRFSADVQASVKSGTARVGMTKEQVYLAMGPPTKVGTVNTNTMTYENILGADLWIYARRRLGKNIGIAFDPSTGKVNRTEGL